MTRIVLPEMQEPIVKEALESLPAEVEVVGADDLVKACKMVKNNEAQAVVAGARYTSREVILAAREYLEAVAETFSSCAVMQKGEQVLLIADPVTCKNPTAEQLRDIILQTYQTARKLLDEPRVAVLSYSTLGSGFNPEKPDPSIVKIREAVEMARAEKPDLAIVGEVQLDAAANAEVAGRKFGVIEGVETEDGAAKIGNGMVAGQVWGVKPANVLICPDLTAANILYKSLEQFGGFICAGLPLQGFGAPISDLSRGSTAKDIAATILTMQKLVEGGR